MSWFVLNTSPDDIKLMFDGTDYLFPAGASVQVDSKEVAQWFVAKTYLPPSPGANRPEAIEPLVILDKSPAKPVASLDFVQELPPEKPAPALSPPPAHKSMPPPPAELVELRKKRALMAAPKEILVQAAQRLGWYKRGMDKGLLVERLAECGYEPPAD